MVGLNSSTEIKPSTVKNKVWNGLYLFDVYVRPPCCNVSVQRDIYTKFSIFASVRCVGCGLGARAFYQYFYCLHPLWAKMWRYFAENHPKHSSKPNLKAAVVNRLSKRPKQCFHEQFRWKNNAFLLRSQFSLTIDVVTSVKSIFRMLLMKYQRCLGLLRKATFLLHLN